MFQRGQMGEKRGRQKKQSATGKTEVKRNTEKRQKDREDDRQKIIYRGIVLNGSQQSSNYI